MVKNTGVKTDEKGYVIVDEFFETSKKGIWAFGDAIGKKMFRHTANTEAEIVWHNAAHGKKSRLNFLTVPHAVFSYPEIASVGLTEEQAIKLMGKHEVLVGKARYGDVARGEAMMETEGFTKAVVHRKTGKILGYHIIGPAGIHPDPGGRECHGRLTGTSGPLPGACTSTRRCRRSF